jgi:hypothetical protein
LFFFIYFAPSKLEFLASNEKSRIAAFGTFGLETQASPEEAAKPE